MVVLFSTQTTEDNTEDALKLVFNEIANLEKTPPTDEEMNIVKKKLKLNLAQVFESSSMINTVIGTAMLDNDLNSVTEFEKVIDNLTSKDIVDFSRKYFDTKKIAITVVHPEGANLKSINKNYEKVHHTTFTGNVELNSKEALDTTKINEYKAVNNFTVITNESNKDLAAFELSISADAPANVKPGVSHILAIMLNRGSKFKDEKKFFSNLENQGIQASFDASRRELKVNSMFLPSDSKNALKSTKEVLLNPRLNQEDLNFAKSYLKDNLQTIPKNSQEAMFKEMFKNQFYGTTTQDLLKSMDNITLADVEGLYGYIMNNAKGQIVISAPFEKNPNLKDEMFNEICTDFPMLKEAKPKLFNSYIPVKEKTVLTQEHAKSQAEIQMGYKFKTNDNLKDGITFELLSTILGGTPSSRLFSDLREKQKLAYQVKSKLGYFDNSGTMSLYIKTTTDDPSTGQKNYDNLQKSIEGFKKHTNLLINEKVNEEELENAKLTMKNRILNGTELTEDKNASIMDGLKSFYGTNLDNQTLEMIDKITTEDIQAAAKYVFETIPTTSIVATKNTIEANQNYLESQGKVING